jgi:2-oxoglutarate dehydrogenase E1 component
VLDYKTYGFMDEDLDMDVFPADGSVVIAEKTPKVLKLRSLIDYMEKVYCGKVGFECMHMLNKDERNFLREKFEDLDKFQPSKEAKLETFKNLLQDHSFNEILEKKFGSSKRFGD